MYIGTSSSIDSVRVAKRVSADVLTILEGVKMDDDPGNECGAARASAGVSAKSING